ncbi:MAG TPA: ABC transporter substrate-binding protein [Gemmatimonadaceae bacterium]|nr:ABC transporter substrate-binding protein [Gemmatimonadaceae bacterium]
MRRPVRAGSLICAVSVCATACATARPTASPTPITTCVVGSGSAGARDTISVAAMEPVDAADAPVPANATERFAFAQLYETLIDVDCDGVPRPALAASWSFDATRTRVTLVLRDGARFSYGKPVTTADVLHSWSGTGARLTPAGRLARQLAGGTTIVDEHTLIVSLPDTAWLVLADPALAVYEPRIGYEWPAGTGPYRIDENASAPTGSLGLTPTSSSADPYLIVRPVPTNDPRDAIDAGADVLVTGDQAAVSYGAARANLASVALPWTHTYALALPTPAPKIAQLLLASDSQSVALRASLARDAVRAEARAARSSYWWDAAARCRSSPGSPAELPSAQRSNRVVYHRDDAVARGLAQRLVALDAQTVAVPLSPNDFVRALHDGGDLAYVLDLPYASLSPCDELRDLWSAAPWLASATGTDTRLIPLVDTRATAIVNRQRVSATVDGRGTLRFGRARSQP